MNIFEVLGYGPILAQDEESRVLITVNGSYFNVWVAESLSEYTNTDCRPLDNGMDGLFGLKITTLMKQAEDYLKQVLEESQGNV